jgi:probable rRNA maturation factor
LRGAGDIEIDIQAASDASGIPADPDLRSWVCAALDGGRHTGPCELSVRIVDAGEMRELNRVYRGKDRPTNVLSFPAGEQAGMPPDAGHILGDLAICAPVLHAEALAQHKRPRDHWAHIVVHGTLHLLGYDHEDPADAAEMEALEIRILAALGVDDPYRER